MKRYKFKDLEEGKVYERAAHGWSGKFIGMYNDKLAEFADCYYDEEKGDYIPEEHGQKTRLTEGELVFDL